MKIMVGIDDTDGVGTRGTGALAVLLGQLIEEKGWGKAMPVTRHQLLVHPSIPYTSHNSSMCFEAGIDDVYLNSFIAAAACFLESECAPGSDPGLCVVNVEQLQDRKGLIDFGYRAKEQIISKEDAYDLAKRAGVHLSEHGGTGQGVIGAMAGVGLRLSGNDGRFKGKLKVLAPDGIISVRDIKLQTGVEEVRSLGGKAVLDDGEMVRPGEKIKAVLLDSKMTLLVFPTGTDYPRWQTCTKDQLKKF
ncbi:MAG TPA: hypothetical protein GXX19_05090 [Syntrophomonadaceae bacterium]|nr:hypothetical protein [Syntrophomonadaceae bacterium]